MKNLIFLAITIPLFLSCGHRQNKSGTSSKTDKAQNFYDRAVKFKDPSVKEKDTLQKAILLLDSAIAIDPEFAQAYIAKQNFQIRLGEYKNVLNTLKKADSLRPQNADIKSTEGFYYLVNGEDQMARTTFLKADSLWNIALDTVSANNVTYRLNILMNKATVLKMLGQETRADSLYQIILRDTLFDKERYKEIRTDIDSLYLNKSKEELYQYLINKIKQ